MENGPLVATQFHPEKSSEAGAALLRGVDTLMTQKLGIPTYLVDDPQNAVAIGSLRALDLYPVLERNLPKF